MEEFLVSVVLVLNPYKGYYDVHDHRLDERVPVFPGNQEFLEQVTGFKQFAAIFLSAHI